MDTYQILAFTLPAAFSFLVYVVSQECLLRIKHDKALALEKERNMQEIIMYYLRNGEKQALESEVRKQLEEKLDNHKGLKEKIAEIEIELKNVKANLGLPK